MINIIIKYIALILISPCIYFFASNTDNPILYALTIVVTMNVLTTKHIIDEIRKIKK